jgi:hypothetical protein
MGPAVFNGGFSTFLAFVLLCTSSSYLFVGFFKVFFLVVIFGLFHGLVLLPTVLSICGPASTSQTTVEPIGTHYEVQRPSSVWSTRMA